MKMVHKPVLVDEVVEALKVRRNARYIDATLGAGGHSIEILSRGGNVLGIDADPGMLEIARQKLGGQGILVNANFNSIAKIARENQFFPVDGILFDLGISSIHYEEKNRGFSFTDPKAHLDMRLSETQGVKASDILNSLPKRQLIEMFSQGMPEYEARGLARKVEEKRKGGPIVTVGDFLSLFPLKTHKIHPATKAFLALRMAVNTELPNITEALDQSIELLVHLGRIAVITFHSTEDNLVKNKFLEFEKKELGKILNKKAILPTDEEIKINPRSRSSQLRVFEKNKIK